MSGMDLTRRPRDMFIVDFGTEMAEAEAADYDMPFAHVEQHVQPVRATNRRKSTRDRWWRHEEARPAMRAAIGPLPRFIATAQTSKHRMFSWLSRPALPDSLVIVVACDDDYAFGVLHSRPHELWSLRLGTSLEDRPRYTPTTTFETFPFPWPLDTPEGALTAEQARHRKAIAEAARELDGARRRWLHPPELVREEADAHPSLPARLLPTDEDAERELRKRTLTALYNARPGVAGAPPRRPRRGGVRGLRLGRGAAPRRRGAARAPAGAQPRARRGVGRACVLPSAGRRGAGGGRSRSWKYGMRSRKPRST